MLNSTAWLKDALDDGTIPSSNATAKATAKKTPKLSEKPKVVGQKDRILSMLKTVLSEPVEKCQPPASNFSRCPNCGKVIC